MDMGAIAARLPIGATVPTALRAMVACSEAIGSNNLTVRTALVDVDDGDLDAWSGGNPILRNGLWLFGRSEGHDLYALWLIENVDLDHAPVVRLDSEGVRNNVIAANLADFARMLAGGKVDGTPPSRALASLLSLSFPAGPAGPSSEEFEAWIDSAIAQERR